MTFAQLHRLVAEALGPGATFCIQIHDWRHSHDGVPAEPQITWKLYLPSTADAEAETFEGATARDLWAAFEAGVSAQGSDVQAASDAVGEGTVSL